MIRRSIVGFAAWIALLGLVAMTPVIAADATEYHYSTTVRTIYGSQYPIAGHLDLQIFPGGHLRGYYWWAYQKQYITVVGGRDGSYIWFDIGPCACDLGLGTGPGGRLHVIGTMSDDGSFSGQIYPEYAAQLSGQETLNAASPEPTSNEQYLFFAKPIETAPANP